jgi:hypothetical protein
LLDVGAVRAVPEPGVVVSVYTKAWAALFGYIVTGVLALSALAFFSGPLSHDLAVTVCVAGLVIVWVFTAIAPANGRRAAPLPSDELVLARAAQIMAEAQQLRDLVYPRRPAGEASKVIGGVVTPEVDS